MLPPVVAAMHWPPTNDEFARLLETLALGRRALAVLPAHCSTSAGVARRGPRAPTTTFAVACRARRRPTWSPTSARIRRSASSSPCRARSSARCTRRPGRSSSRASPQERGGTPVLTEAIARHGRAARRRRARHALVPHHAGRPAPASRLRGGRLPGDQRRHRRTASCRWRWRAPGGATVYAGTPSFLANLGDTAREMGLDPRRDLHYRVGFSTAEALTPALRRELHDTFGIELFDHCGEAQIGPLAGECRAHDGMHLHARDLFCEFLDPETRRAGRSRAAPASWSRRSSARARCRWCATRRATSSACSPGACAVRRSVAAHRLRRPGRRHPEDQGRARASGAGAPRAVASFPELGRFQIVVEHPAGRALRPRRAARRARARRPADRRRRCARAIAERVKADGADPMDVELVAPRPSMPEGAGARRASPTAMRRSPEARA